MRYTIVRISNQPNIGKTYRELETESETLVDRLAIVYGGDPYMVSIWLIHTKSGKVIQYIQGIQPVVSMYRDPNKEQ